MLLFQKVKIDLMDIPVGKSGRPTTAQTNSEADAKTGKGPIISFNSHLELNNSVPPMRSTEAQC